MIGGKRKGSVVPPPPSSTAKDGGGVVVGGKCAENGNALPPVHESAKEAEKKLHKTPAKPAAYGYISSGSDDDEDSEDEEESEEEEEENEDNDSEIEDGEANADADVGAGDGEEESIDKPKLAEGFYLIEAVRNRRTRRGKREYRIKWRGWPESENTWEPMENLKTVPHVIAAYEESLRAKRARKRKRKNSYSFTQTRKRPRRCSSTTAVKRTVSSAPPLKITEETIPAVVAETDTVVLNSGSGVGNDTEITDLEAGEDLNENGEYLVPSGNEGTGIEDSDVILTSDKEKSLVEQSQVKPQEAQLTGENAVANGSEKTESGEEALLEAGRSTTGARRRKSGPVRRFKLETNSGGADVLENTALNGVSTCLDGNRLPENLDSMSKDVGCKETRDTRKNIYDIVEIIKPIKYTSFMARNTLDICVTFLVKRSDGKEMTVDNKFLKAHCPVLLVDYYEQRLRY